jgi:hypothetical protein
MQNTLKSNFRWKHIRNLAALANIDDVIDDEEYNFLCELSKRYEISVKEVDDIIANLGSAKPEIPENVDQRVGQLLDLIRMMMMDKRIDKREVYFCQNVAIGFGFDKRIVEFLVKKYKSDPESFAKWQDLTFEANKFLIA